MNSKDYARIMKENDLIETPLSCFYIAKAMRMQDEIKKVKGWSKQEIREKAAVEVYQNELMRYYHNRKTEYIKQALKESASRKEMISIAGNLYYTQIEIIKRVLIDDRWY